MRFQWNLVAAALTLLPAFAQGQVRPTAPGQPAQPRSYTYSPPLYTYPNVSRSLNLTPQQSQRLAEMNRRLEAANRERFDRIYRSTDRDRDIQLRELQSRYYNEWMRSAGDVFNEEQMSRYRQLDYQFQGPNAILQPEMQRRLELTERQLNQLREYQAKYNSQFQTFSNVDPARREDLTKRWDEQRRETAERINSILTDNQRRMWSQMTGESFRFAPPFSTIPPRR